jgi:lipoprotein-anchoring transpeptidase ErfK/SrfK
LVAIGGAGLITLLTVGGALGLGPGAAMGDTDRRGRDSAGDTAQGLPTGSRSDPSADAGDSASPDSTTGDDWLTIDEAPATPDASDDQADTALPAGSGTGKRVVFDMSDQRVWLVGASGKVARTYLVSGSLHDNLEPGTYAVYSKSRNAVGFDHGETMKYMVRFAHGASAAIGFHDVPAYSDGTLVQTKAELGEPQSAGCIRQWADDAKALWKFADVDTKVVVTA